MGLLPKFYGQDISALFKQRYHGDVTIVPDMKVEESLGVKAIMHPSKEDMTSYIRLVMIIYFDLQLLVVLGVMVTVSGV